MTEKRLLVSLPGRDVGELAQNRDGMTTWRPDFAWERDGEEPRLGLDFLRKRGGRASRERAPPRWF